jgi:hypothetical protein
MAKIHVPNFEGLTPKVDPSLLKDTEAVECENARLDRGNLIPWKGTAAEATVNSGAKTVYDYDGSWLYWTNFVDVVPTPVLADAYKRVFYTGDGQPQYTYQGRPTTAGVPNGFDLGVPAPGLVTTHTTSTTAGDLEEDRYYVYTYITPLGEEGPPSYPGDKITVIDGNDVFVTFTTETLGNYNLGTGAKRRLYRTAAGTTSTEYQFVADIPIASLTVTDDIDNDQLGEVLPSTTWTPPPRTGDVGIGALEGLTTLTSGFLAGFSGNTLCFSEQFIPSAWPVAYRTTFDADIVGLGVAGNSLVVLTKSFPYLMSGDSPAEMTAVRIETAQACSSKDSLVDAGDFLIYASPDGIMAVSEAGVENLTQDILTRDQWQAYTPSTLQGYYYEDMYLGISDTKSFLITKDGVLTDLPGYTAINGVNDFLTDRLLLLQSNGAIVAFNEGSALTAKWKSKSFRSMRPSVLGTAEVDCAGPVTFKLYADGVLKLTKNLTTLTQFRLPSGFLAVKYAFSLEGTGEVFTVTMASTTMEKVMSSGG